MRECVRMAEKGGKECLIDFPLASLYIYPRISTTLVTVGIGLMARTCIRDGFKKPTASQDYPINKHEK